MREAMFYERVNNKVRCELCPRRCAIEPGKRGYCGVRENREGKLYSLVFGKACSVVIDPIEKKPFYHYIPGMQSLSVATVGCNLSCKHCQNWEISQTPRETGEIFGDDVSPEKLIEIAKRHGIKSFSWTYTEPTVFFEYFYETAKLTKREFTHNWVSNGFIAEKAAEAVAKHIDAVNIDYKGDDKFYREVCNAWLEPVHRALKIYRKHGVWIEVTNLIIQGYNDRDDIILEMVRWIREHLGRETPLHFSAYYPAYRMEAPPTPRETLERALKLADEYLDFVYVGNVRHERESTFCPNCKKLLIKRVGFFVERIDLERRGNNFHCPECGRKIPIAGAEWMERI